MRVRQDMRVSAQETPGEIGFREYEPIQPGRGRSGSFTERAKKFLGPDRDRGHRLREQGEGDPAPAAEDQGALDLGDDAGLDRRLLPDLGLVVRRWASCSSCSSTRWVTCSSFAARESRRRRRCSSRSWAPSSQPSRWATTRAPRRASALPGPVLGSIACLVPLGDLAGDRQRVLAGARVRRLLPQPLQPPPRAAARRRPRDGRALAVGLGRRLRRPRRAHLRLPEPDHDPDPPPRRDGDLQALQGPQHARGARLPRHPATRRGSASRSSTWASRPCSRSACPRRSSSATSATSE